VRIATWNVNSLTARLPRVLDWLTSHDVDVLCMQETKQVDAAFPADTFAALGYRSIHHGDGRWNGVAILSRIGLEEPRTGLASAEVDDQGTRLVSAACGGIRVHSVYVPNGRSLDSEHYTAKLAWLARLRAYLVETCDPASPVAVCGDFNVAPDDRDLWDPAAFVGATHVSEPERLALKGILGWGLHDVFRRDHPDGGVFSWWDYRAGDFHMGRGMRIDLVLLSGILAERVTGTFIDRDARKGKKPSDHAPVVVDLHVGVSPGGVSRLGSGGPS
jgi:exodeoxyribonuclease-3